jgi:hypothetical protein
MKTQNPCEPFETLNFVRQNLTFCNVSETGVNYQIQFNWHLYTETPKFLMSTWLYKCTMLLHFILSGLIQPSVKFHAKSAGTFINLWSNKSMINLARRWLYINFNLRHQRDLHPRSPEIQLSSLRVKFPPEPQFVKKPVYHFSPEPTGSPFRFAHLHKLCASIRCIQCCS